MVFTRRRVENFTCAWEILAAHTRHICVKEAVWKAWCVVCSGCPDEPPQTGGLHRNVFLTVLEVGSPRSRCQQQVWCLGLQMAAFVLCPHMAFPLCAHFWSLFLKGHWSFWIRVPTPWPQLALIISVKALYPHSHFGGYGFSIQIWEGFH